MLKKIAVVATMLAVFCASAVTFAADLTDPNEIIKKATDRMLELNNYKYTIVKEGWDFDLSATAEATKNLVGEAEGSALAAQAESVEDVDASMPKWMLYSSDIKFMKPWAIQMKINYSDYLPPILDDAVLTYNYSKKKMKWIIRAPKVGGISLPRELESESGNFLYSNFNVDYIQLDVLLNACAPTLEGTEKIDGKDAYKIVFDVKNGKPKKGATVDLAAWKIPPELHFKVEDEIDWYAKEDWSKAVYYFDVKTLDMLGRKIYLGDANKATLKKYGLKLEKGDIYIDEVYKGVESGTLTQKDFKP